MSYKVLIVDDSKLARMSIIKILNALQPDWTRVEASNADEALTQFGAERPDIVLMDVNMPGRDGLELAAEFSRMNPGMPLAIVSANIQNEIVARARSVGADFLPKPLTEDALSQFLAVAKGKLKASA